MKDHFSEARNHLLIGLTKRILTEEKLFLKVLKFPKGLIKSLKKPEAFFNIHTRLSREKDIKEGDRESC